MAKIQPFYSSLTRDVHHDNDACTEGNNIEARYVVRGDGGLPLCAHCKKL